MTYVWKKSIHTLLDPINKPILAQYLLQAQEEIQECMMQLNDSNAQLLIPVMNEYDAKFRLMVYYLEHLDLIPDKNEKELLFLVENDYERWFQEGMEEQDCHFIRRNSLFSSIGPYGSISTYLWEPPTPVHSKIVESGQAISRYFEELQKEAREIIPLLSGGTFDDIYPSLFRVDLKCQMVIQSVSCVYFRSLTYEQLREEIESNCIPYFHDIISDEEINRSRSLRCMTTGTLDYQPSIL